MCRTSRMDGLRKFDGVGRRFQQYGDITFAPGKQATLVDDYGHHPREMKATLEAVRNAWPTRRLGRCFSRTVTPYPQCLKILRKCCRKPMYWC